MKTKAVTIYAVSRANIDPTEKGYAICLSDPDPGTALKNRSFGSGYAVPVEAQVPADWTVAEAKDGITYLWNGETPMACKWHSGCGVLTVWPVFLTLADAEAQGAVLYLHTETLDEALASCCPA